MAFFCPTTGARIVAPGKSKTDGGLVPEYDGSPAHVAAENAAMAALSAARKSPEEIGASEEAKLAAASAALDVLASKSSPKPQGKGQ